MSSFALSLDVHAEHATLFLRGALQHPEIRTAARMCEALPRGVRLLRLDLRDIVAIDGAARSGLRSLLRDWRCDRLGHITLAADPSAYEALIGEDDIDDARAMPRLTERAYASVAMIAV